jgi:hypothetical protein
MLGRTNWVVIWRIKSYPSFARLSVTAAPGTARSSAKPAASVQRHMSLFPVRLIPTSRTA